MFFVAGGVGASSCIIDSIFAFLRLFRRDEPFFLSRVKVGDESFLCLEVVGYGLGLVFIAAFLEDGFAKHVAKRVKTIGGMHDGTVHVHANVFRREVDVLILHICIAIKVCVFSVHEKCHGVGGCIDNRSIECALLL